jgi:hypothetical protein
VGMCAPWRRAALFAPQGLQVKNSRRLYVIYWKRKMKGWHIFSLGRLGSCSPGREAGSNPLIWMWAQDESAGSPANSWTSEVFHSD